MVKASQWEPAEEEEQEEEIQVLPENGKMCLSEVEGGAHKIHHQLEQGNSKSVYLILSFVLNAFILSCFMHSFMQKHSLERNNFKRLKHFRKMTS